MHGKSTLVRHHLKYQLKGWPLTISFGLGVDVAVRLIIGLTTLRIWSGSFDFITNEFIVLAINTQLP